MNRKKPTREYSKASQKEVEKEMRRFKKGKAESGPHHRKVKNRAQAIAIGLSKARKKGAKVPDKPTKKKRAMSYKIGKKTLTKGWPILKNENGRWVVIAHASSKGKALASIRVRQG